MVAIDEINAHERTALSFLMAKEASPLTKGITINKTGIIPLNPLKGLFVESAKYKPRVLNVNLVKNLAD